MLPTMIRRYTSTVSEKEISHFSKLAAHWWDENGEFKYLHRMNPTRMAFLRQRLLHTEHFDSDNFQNEQWLKGKRILDVGCGGGLFTEALARGGGTVVGVDASRANIEIARLHASQDALTSQVDYQVANVESLVNQPRRYDIVTAMEVLEHVENPTLFLRSLLQLLKPSGHLIMSTISRTVLSQLLTITIAENAYIGSVAAGTHTYSKFIRPEELRSFFASEFPTYPDNSTNLQHRYGFTVITLLASGNLHFQLEFMLLL